MPGTLCIFPAFYPYTKYEVFLENEVNVIAPYFEKVYVFPRTKDDQPRPMPANCESIDWIDQSARQKLSFARKMDILLIALKQIPGRFWLKKMRRFVTDLKFLAAKQKEAMALQAILEARSLRHAVYYSVWAHDSATTLALLRRKGFLQKLYARAHGYDVYHFRRTKAGYVQFLSFNLKYIQKIFCASKATEKYLSEVYPSHRTKFFTRYLGVTDRGQNPHNPALFNVLSVSNFHPVKRLPLIAETLGKLKCNITWYHIGADPDKIRQLAKSLPPNIQTHFMDRLSQDMLVDFYHNTPVSLFLQFSSSEGGVPMAIQEALSFGVPVMATAAGGIPEIVNHTNGFLLPPGFTADDAAALLQGFPLHFLNTGPARAAVKADWKQRFDAEKNLKEMALSLLETVGDKEKS